MTTQISTQKGLPAHSYPAHVERVLNPRTFRQVDDELYAMERGFYSACAGGAHFDVTPEWKAKRAALEREWYALCPYPHAGKPAPAERPVTALQILVCCALGAAVGAVFAWYF